MGKKRRSVIVTPPLPSGIFDVILADPPWDYGGGWSKPSQGGMTYPTMTEDELCSMKVASIAADSSVLLLWGTWPKLKTAIRVLEAWGFEYKTGAFVWLKTYDDGRPVCGLGRYTKTSTEYVLLGTRGKELVPGSKVKSFSGLMVADLTINQFLPAIRRKHSQKPDEVYDKVNKLYPRAKRLELFARKKHPGWTAWGLEAPVGAEPSTDRG